MDQQKSSTIIITKRARILLILFCTVCGIVFTLMHSMFIAIIGETILSFFAEKERNVPSLSPSEIIDYLKWSNESACKNQVFFGGSLFVELLSPKSALNEGLKAVCLDEKFAPRVNNCLIYSFGIHDDWNFEERMEEHQGCNVLFF